MPVIAGVQDPRQAAEEQRQSALRRVRELQAKGVKLPPLYNMTSNSVCVKPPGQDVRWVAPRNLERAKKAGWEVVPPAEVHKYGRMKEDADAAKGAVCWGSLILMRRDIDISILSIEQRGLEALDQVSKPTEEYRETLIAELGDTPTGAKLVKRLEAYMDAETPEQREELRGKARVVRGPK